MPTKKIDVIATTISGSISDRGKIGRIVPLFHDHGWDNVELHSLESHADARARTRDVVSRGGRIVISAGGSGTFNSVLEGCIDAEVDLREISLGFLRKGSADLIGKTLGMPDEIEAAIEVFSTSLAESRTLPCDIIEVSSGEDDPKVRHFAGYSGVGIFGRVPHYTENRFIKFYKGVLGQLFGDMGPFFVGASLATIEKSLRSLARKPPLWHLSIDGAQVAEGAYQAMILVNGDLGDDLPFARSEPLGSGAFYLFGLRDIGLARIPGQFRHAWDATILDDPERWGFEAFRVSRELVIETADGSIFPVNVDGSTKPCAGQARFTIVGQIKLISR